MWSPNISTFSIANPEQEFSECWRAQVDVAAGGAREAVVAQLRAVLGAAVAGAGVAAGGGLNRQRMCPH